jgi:hypothetical protein
VALITTVGPPDFLNLYGIHAGHVGGGLGMRDTAGAPLIRNRPTTSNSEDPEHLFPPIAPRRRLRIEWHFACALDIAVACNLVFRSPGFTGFS